LTNFTWVSASESGMRRILEGGAVVAEDIRSGPELGLEAEVGGGVVVLA